MLDFGCACTSFSGGRCGIPALPGADASRRPASNTRCCSALCSMSACRWRSPFLSATPTGAHCIVWFCRWQLAGPGGPDCHHLGELQSICAAMPLHQLTPLGYSDLSRGFLTPGAATSAKSSLWHLGRRGNLGGMTGAGRLCCPARWHTPSLPHLTSGAASGHFRAPAPAAPRRPGSP